MDIVDGESPDKSSTFAALAGLGKRPWLVLGGGGLKGLAHVGAWRALGEAGVRPQGIIGTSIGALVAALASSGMSCDEMREHALAVTRDDIVRLNRRAAWINGIRQPSVFKGEALMEFFDALLPDEGWDALGIPVLMNAVDLEDGSTEWFGPGARTDISLVEAVYASSALPVFYPPFQTNGHAYVDGGASHPLALQRAEDEGATGIIAIDPGAGESGDLEKVLSKGMVAVHQRIFAIMTWRRRRDLLAAWDGPPVMYVRPGLEGYETFDFDRLEFFLEEGYRAMREALEAR